MRGTAWVERVGAGPIPERRRSLGVESAPAERIVSFVQETGGLKVVIRV